MQQYAALLFARLVVGLPTFVALLPLFSANSAAWLAVAKLADMYE